MNPKSIESQKLGNWIESLNWRYATKTFDPRKKIPQNQWERIREAFRLAPSSYGLQPWKFVEVQSEELRKKLRAKAYNQSQVTDCSHFVVIAYHHRVQAQEIENYIHLMSEVRGTSKEQLSGFQNVMIKDLCEGPRSQVISEWAARQTYIVMGFALFAAALEGVDACPMEGIDPNAFDEILELSQTPFRTVTAIAFGYRHPDDWASQLKKVRYPLEKIWEVKT